MRKRTIRTFLPLLAATVIGAAQAAEDPSGAALAESCATCHGPTGVSEVPTIPTIAGYDQAYFVDDMLAYKAGDINSPLMETLAQRYSRDELQAMAGFYARHRYEPAPQEFDVERARRGETLHVEYCGICHMDGGSIEAAREWSMPPPGRPVEGVPAPGHRRILDRQATDAGREAAAGGGLPGGARRRGRRRRSALLRQPAVAPARRVVPGHPGTARRRAPNRSRCSKRPPGAGRGVVAAVG